MRRLAIVADDLTGGLDATAPFAGRGGVELSIRHLPSASVAAFAVDTETRDAASIAVERALHEVLPLLPNAGVALKKVDSLMRGNTCRELALCWQSGLFGSMVVAPAFPLEHRVTRAGCQLADGARIDIATGLAAHGVDVRRVPRGTTAAGEGVFLCDAESDADLAAVIALGNLAPPVLWCGSAGLARALAGEIAPVELRGGCRLLVVGTRHPGTLRQVEHLRARHGGIVFAIRDADDIDRALDGVAAAVVAHDRAALVFDIGGDTPAAAAELQMRAFERLPRRLAPELLVVTGGETLVRLCDAVGASRLAVKGEWVPGVGVAEFSDGHWNGTTVVGKSGGFGAPGLLTRLLQ